MMADDARKTKRELLKELEGLRQHIRTLECGQTPHRPDAAAETAHRKGHEEIGASRSPEARLRRSEARLQATIESLPFDFFLIDEDGRYSMQNAIGKGLWGHMVGKRPEDVCPDQRTLAVWQDNNRRAWAGEVVRGEVILRPQGVEGCYYNIVSPIREGDRVCGILGVNIDITDRKRMEEALGESERRYRSTVDFMEDGLTVVDRQLRIILVNQTLLRWARRYGLNTHMIGRPLFEEFPFLPARVRDEYERVFQTGQPLVTEEVSHFNETEVITEIRKVPVMDGGQVTKVIALIRDITQRKNAEQRLLTYQSRLKSLASELTLTEERLKREIATALHDSVSQALAMAKLKVRTLLESSPDAATQKELADAYEGISQALDQSRSMTSRLSYPVLSVLGLERAVQRWLTEEIQDKHGLSVDYQCTGQTGDLDADVQAVVFRGMRELLANVIKHARASHVRVSIRNSDDRITLVVEDDGVGLTSNEPGAHARGEGEFGLLSIHEALDCLGGRLELSSEPGKGCRVTLVAPCKGRSRT